MGTREEGQATDFVPVLVEREAVALLTPSTDPSSHVPV
jgi:hypothetical protein